MKTLTLAALSTTLALLAGTAAAQTTTDEARTLAAQATAAHERQALAPAAQPVAIGDYRAEAHNQSRLAQYQAQQRAVQAYAAGVRTQPLVVNSEDSARAEAQRVHAEQALAGHAAALRSTVAAQ
jgi:hypothetical protein